MKTIVIIAVLAVIALFQPGVALLVGIVAVVGLLRGGTGAQSRPMSATRRKRVRNLILY